MFKVVFMYGLFCHGALKLDLSTLFATLFILTRLHFIFKDFICLYVNEVFLMLL